ncbi:hypothetical protein V8C37DRAFT_367984 [Trichoderma ceciliae]
MLGLFGEFLHVIFCFIMYFILGFCLPREMHHTSSNECRFSFSCFYIYIHVCVCVCVFCYTSAAE